MTPVAELERRQQQELDDAHAKLDTFENGNAIGFETWRHQVTTLVGELDGQGALARRFANLNWGNRSTRRAVAYPPGV
jgi:hypothetical protein